MAEQKAELAFEGCRCVRLMAASQIDHHAKGRAFAGLLDVARDPASHHRRRANELFDGLT